MTGPLVSVILPVYNQAGTLCEAVESVLAQVYGNFELIVIDDASTDNSLKVAAFYAARDNRVRVLRNAANSRRSPAPWECRNDGIAVASGTYVAYLDSDNTWRPTFLARMVAALQARPEVMLAIAQSCNHHPPDRLQAHMAADRRVPTSSGQGWVLYALDEVRPSELGESQYIDTNEMVHPARVFDDLPECWRTRHPRATWVNANLGGASPLRRHNDLDLAERIIARYGLFAVELVREVLVDYYYPGSVRRESHQDVLHSLRAR